MNVASHDKKDCCFYEHLCKSQSEIYKIYKIMCKILKCEAIYCGKLSIKSVDENTLYALDIDGLKNSLGFYNRKEPFSCYTIDTFNFKYCNLICLRKNCSHDSRQNMISLIVKRILKVLEKHDVVMFVNGMWKNTKLKRHMNFEKLLVEYDLKKII